MRIRHAYTMGCLLYIETEATSLIAPLKLNFNLQSDSSVFMLHVRTGIPASIWEHPDTAPDAFVGARLQPPTYEMMHHGVAIRDKEKNVLSLQTVINELRRFYQEHSHA